MKINNLQGDTLWWVFTWDITGEIYLIKNIV